MNKERLEEIREANKARTPGKWGWAFNLKGSVDLRSLDGWQNFIIVFRRWKMHDAQPFFRNEALGIIETFTKWAKPYASYAVQGLGPDCIEHPDARFIAKAPEYVTELLELADQQVAEIGRLKAEIIELNTPFKPVKAVSYSMAVELEIEGVPV